MDRSDPEGNPPARRDIILCCCADPKASDSEKAMLALYLLEYRRRRVYEFTEECLTEHLWMSSDGKPVDVPLRHKNEFSGLRDISRISSEDRDSVRLAVIPSKETDDTDLILRIWRELKIPVLVISGNTKDKQLVKDAGGGLWYDNYYEFEGILDYILNDPIRASKLGGSGCRYDRSLSGM